VRLLLGQDSRYDSAHPLGVGDCVDLDDLVFISVVGADRVPVENVVDRAMFGYFASKLAAERVVAGSGLPWTTPRATHFYDLFLLVARVNSSYPRVM